MQAEQLALKELIAEVVQDLICESHPEVCQLRDEAYDRLEQMLIDLIESENGNLSVGSAVAHLEMELTHI